MINVLRKNQKGLWIVIALLCIPFVFYFSNSKIGPAGKNEIGRIYGKPVSTVELQRSARLFNLARQLGMYEFLQDMVSSAQSENDAYSEFTWNRLILQHEAERLGIRPLPNEVVDVIRGLQPFRGEAGFDINKYNEFTKAALPAMGFGDAQLEELAADSITLTRLKDLVGTGVQIAPTESQENYERAYGKLNVIVARLQSADLAKEAQTSDDDINKYYEAHKATLTTDEKRKVSFVTFALTPEQKALTGKERTEPLQKLADRANDFTQALLENGAEFHQVAAKFGLPVETTGDFTKATPDPLFASNPQLAGYAFQLSAEQPNSDPIQSPEDFRIMHLEGIEPARPLTLDEARPKIVETLNKQRANELMAMKGSAVSTKIRAAVKAGTPPEQAIQLAGLQPERIPPFALMDPPKMRPSPDKPAEPEAPDLNNIKSAVAELQAGAVSEFVPTPTGGLVAVLEKRELPSGTEGGDAARTAFTNRILRSKQQVAFREWMQQRRRDAGVPQSQQEPNTFEFNG